MIFVKLLNFRKKNMIHASQTAKRDVAKASGLGRGGWYHPYLPTVVVASPPPLVMGCREGTPAGAGGQEGH